MANKMNMAIAKTHRLSTRVVGMQITSGTFVGIILSAVQMSAGFLIVGSGLIQGNPLIAVLLIVIGAALAVLIERLSLGGLSAIRMNSERLRALEDGFHDRLVAEKRDPTEFEQKDYDRRRKDIKRSRWIAVVFAGVGMALSAGVGDVFWHTLFENLGTVGYILSTACALVIGLTFVHSELYKVAIDGVLVDILRDLRVQKAAVAVEGESMQVDMLEDAFETVKKDDEARRPAEEKVKRAVVRQLSARATEFEAVQGQVLIEEVSGGAISHRPLALPAPRGKYAQNKDELIRLLRGNPGLSQREVAAHFTISRSTAGEWLKRARAGV